MNTSCANKICIVNPAFPMTTPTLSFPVVLETL